MSRIAGVLRSEFRVPMRPGTSPTGLEGITFPVPVQGDLYRRLPLMTPSLYVSADGAGAVPAEWPHSGFPGTAQDRIAPPRTAVRKGNRQQR